MLIFHLLLVLVELMGWESFGMVTFDLGPLLKLKSAYNSLISIFVSFFAFLNGCFSSSFTYTIVKECLYLYCFTVSRALAVQIILGFGVWASQVLFFV